MFTILIPVFRPGYLESQLYWLSKQHHKDFNVLVMDARYKVNRNQPFIQRNYPFKLYHVPMVHNTLIAKRFDNSVYNNLALLSPTFHFVFLSDTTYPVPEFTEQVSKQLFKFNCVTDIFYSQAIDVQRYDRSNHTIDVTGVKHVKGKVALMGTVLTDKSTFIHILNGMDEATTAAYSPYKIFPYIPNIPTLIKSTFIKPLLYHFDMSYPIMDVDRWQLPCTKCGPLFTVAALTTATSSDDFMRRAVDREVIEQMTYFEPEIESMMFQCPNCGFGGVLSPLEYRQYLDRTHTEMAPVGLLDRRAGRNLGSVYERMSLKVNNSMDARLAYLRSSY